MSNGIAALASLQGTEPATTAGAGSSARSSDTAFTSAGTTIAQVALHPNPSFSIDASLGLVVMEFRNASGGVSSTIPTSQQIEAYRRAAGTHQAASAEPGSDPTNPIGTGNAATGSLNTGSLNAGSLHTGSLASGTAHAAVGHAASIGGPVVTGGTVRAAPTAVVAPATGSAHT